MLTSHSTRCRSNSRIRSRRSKAAIALTAAATAEAVAGLLSANASAATVTFSAPSTIAGDSDVLNVAATNYAFDFNNNNAINGVSFVGTSVSGGSFGSGNVSIQNAGNTFTGFGGGSNLPFSGLSSGYQNLLSGAEFFDGNTTVSNTFTLNNLISGHEYATQVWVNDSRGQTRQETINGGNNTVTLKYAANPVSGGVGQYTIGSFLANASTQAFTLTTTNGNTDVQLNAVQLRDVTGVWSGAASGTWDSGSLNFTGNQSFNTISSTLSPPVTTIYFADTDGFRNSVTNSTVSIQSAGVSTGTVVFQSNSVNYTFNNSSGSTGITGSTAVLKTGTGTVTFALGNTYTGLTTLNAGTLSLGNTSALAGGGNITFTGGTLQFTGSNTNDYSTKIVNSTSSIAINTNSQNVTFAGVLGNTNTGGLTKTGNGTLTLSNGNSSYSGVTVINQGVVAAGTLALNGSNSSIGTGGVTLNGGTLRATNGFTSAAFDRTITIGAGGGTLDTNANFFALGSGLTGSGPLTFLDSSGSSNQFLVVGSNTAYTGNVSVGNGSNGSGSIQDRTNLANPFGTGTIQINGGGVVTADNNGGTIPTTLGNNFILNGGGLGTQSVNMLYTGTVSLTAGTTSSLGNPVGSTGTVTLNNVISGGSTAGLTINSNSSVTLSGNNSYSGGTTISAGTLQAGIASTTTNSGASMAITSGAIGTGLLTVNGGTLDLSTFSLAAGGLSGSGGTVASSSTGTAGNLTIVTGATTRTYAGIIANATGSGNKTVAVTIAGNGTQILTGANTYTAGTSILSGSTLQIGNGTTNGTFNGNYSVASGATFKVNGTNSPTWANITGAGTLELTSAGSPDWTQPNLPAVFTGTLQIDKGRVNNPTSGGMTSIVVQNGGQFAMYNGGTYAENFTIAGQGWGESGFEAALRLGPTSITGTVALSGNAAVSADSTGTFTNVISGNSSANLTIGTNFSNGTVVFSGNNTYFGGTSVAFGTLKLSSSLALQNSTLTAGGPVFDSSVSSHAFTFGGLSGSSNLTLADNAGTPNAVALSVGNNNGNTTYSGALSGLGSLTKIGSGTLELQAASTFSGNITVSAGTLKASTTNSNTTTPTSGPLGNATVARTISVGSGATLNFAVGNVFGSGFLAQTNVSLVDSGTITNTSGDTISLGPLTLNGGILTASSGTSNSAFQSYVFSQQVNIIGNTSSTMSTAGSSNAGFHLGANTSAANIVFNVDPNSTGASLLISAPLIGGSNGQGGGALTKTGPGTLTLSADNSYSAGTTVSAGTLSLGGSNNGSSRVGSGNLTINSGATVIATQSNVLGFDQDSTTPSVIINGGAFNLQANDGSALNWTLNSGNLTGSGSPGTGLYFNRTATITSTGNSTISEPKITNQGFTPNFVVSSGTLTVSSAISGTGNLTQAGPGTLVLSGASGYTGNTTISAGTLRANNSSGSSATGSGSITVAASITSGNYTGGTLGGNGNVSGTVTLNGSITAKLGGIITAGADTATIGKLTTGNETWNGGAAYQWKINAAGTGATLGNHTTIAGAAGTSYDTLQIGSATSGSLLNVTQTGGLAAFTIEPLGTLTGLTSGSTYNWVIGQIGAGTGTQITVNGNATNPSSSLALSSSIFALDTSGLSINGNTQFSSASNFSLYFETISGNNDLVLSYNAAPEPGTTMLILGGVVPMLLRRRRRNSPPTASSPQLND